MINIKKVWSAGGYIIVSFSATEMKMNPHQYGVIRRDLFTGRFWKDLQNMEFDGLDSIDEAIEKAIDLGRGNLVPNVHARGKRAREKEVLDYLNGLIIQARVRQRRSSTDYFMECPQKGLEDDFYAALHELDILEDLLTLAKGEMYLLDQEKKAADLRRKAERILKDYRRQISEAAHIHELLSSKFREAVGFLLGLRTAQVIKGDEMLAWNQVFRETWKTRLHEIDKEA